MIAFAAIAALAAFNITSGTIGTGEAALGVKVLQNLDTGESFSIVWESGGKTESLYLRSRHGSLRSVLQTHEGNATAIRLAEHYAGSILLPWANRIEHGRYEFFGKPHQLPLNENVPGVRSDALHGFLYNRSLSVLSATVGGESATLVLGYNFTGKDTPGWPFAAEVQLEYTLQAGSGPGEAGVAWIKTRVASLEERASLPFYNSWHPYFLVTDVSRARVKFDACGGSVDGAWRHVTMGEGAPRKGNLIPTGDSAAWRSDFKIGGNMTRPAYMDDEFSATVAEVDALSAGCGPYYRHRIIDEGGQGDVSVLIADRSHRVAQIFTGAKEGWGWDAVALEPMTGLANAFNNGDGLRVLLPGQTFEATMGATLE
jgi:aldose 1-epimerase